MSAGWIKVYPPGAYRGRDGWHVRGRDMFGRDIGPGRLPPQFVSQGTAERAAKRLLKLANRRPPDPRPEAAAGPEPVAEDRTFKAAAKAYKRIRRPSEADWARIEKLMACPEIGPVHVEKLGTDQAARFAETTKSTAAPDTLNREIITPYSAVLHYAYEIKWCGDPKIRRYHENEDDRPAVAPAEVDKLIAHLDASTTLKPRVLVKGGNFGAYKVAVLEYLRLPDTRVADLLKARPEDLGRGGEDSGWQLAVWRGDRFDRRESVDLPAAVGELIAALEPRPDGWLMPWRQKTGYHRWLKPLAIEAKITAQPRVYHRAVDDAELEAGIQRMIAIARAERPQRVSLPRIDELVPYKVALIEYLRLRGSRISDALNIHRDRDLELQAAKVKLTIGKARDKVRWLPLSPLVVALFANLARCEDGWLFPWRTRSGVYAWLTPACERAGVKVTPHMFRHALGEEAIDADVDLVTLQNMGAWASLNSVRPYARVSQRRLEEADRKRAELQRSGEHREMVAADLATPALSVAVAVMRRKA